MRHSRRVFAGVVVLAFAATAVAAAQPSSAPAPSVAHTSIAKPLHFRDLGRVKDWRKGEKDTIVYVQVEDNSWYRVDLYETCMKFVNDKGLRFITEELIPGRMVSKVIADKYICTVLEINKIDAPGSSHAAK